MPPARPAEGGLMAKLVKQLQHPQPDTLLAVKEEIRAYAAEHGLTVFHGTDSGESDNHMLWDRRAGGDWKAFLECARSIGVKMIYLESTEFMDIDLFELPDDDLRRTFTPRVGQTADVSVLFLWDGFIHAYREVADWYAHYELLTEDFMESDEEDGEEDDVDKDLPF